MADPPRPWHPETPSHIHTLATLGRRASGERPIERAEPAPMADPFPSDPDEEITRPEGVQTPERIAQVQSARLVRLWHGCAPDDQARIIDYARRLFRDARA